MCVWYAGITPPTHSYLLAGYTMFWFVRFTNKFIQWVT